MRIRAAAITAWVGAMALAVASCATRASVQAYPRLEASLPAEATFAVVGDLQDTWWGEQLIGREDNERERSMLVNHLAGHRPSMLLSLGDMVFSGESPSAWRAFDDVMKPLAGTPIVAVAGNHDWYRRSAGEAINAGFRRRFLSEAMPLTWHEHRVGSLAILVIDSNLDKLKPEARGAQLLWYADRLRSLDGDGSVRGVMVAVHHPRYTNGTGPGVGDWDEGGGAATRAGSGMASYGTLFDESSKAFLMVSGHTHSYERFRQVTSMGPKHYVVSGGGGGPRRPVQPRTGRHPDRYLHPGEEGELELRPFHVIWVSQDIGGVRLLVMGLEKGADAFARMEEILLPWPK